jgi:hypothetical protein
MPTDGPTVENRSVKWLYSNVASLAAREHVPVFQRYNGHQVRFHRAKIFDTMEGEQIPYSQMQALMFGLLSEYTSESVESLMKRLGTQSLRSGGATTVAAKGVWHFQRHGG